MTWHRMVAGLIVVQAMGVAAMQGQSVSPDWVGTWRGTLENFPARPGAAEVQVVREVGPLPEAPGACTTFRTTYIEGGTVRGTKEYRLCREAEPGSYVVDEGDGIRLPARWMGDLLLAPFKYATTLLVVTTRVRGDVMEEEILTAQDQPATDAVVGLRAQGVQRLVLRRAPAQ